MRFNTLSDNRNAFTEVFLVGGKATELFKVTDDQLKQGIAVSVQVERAAGSL